MSSSDSYCRVPGSGGIEPDTLDPAARVSGFDTVEKDLTEEQALAESTRCLASVHCTYCEVCQLLCPDLCITRDSETGHIVIDLDYCKGCGLCAHFCPKGAIQMVEE